MIKELVFVKRSNGEINEKINDFIESLRRAGVRVIIVENQNKKTISNILTVDQAATIFERNEIFNKQLN